MLVVISDFHLSEGRRPNTRKLAPAEDFFFDEEFARFLAYLDLREPGGVHLVVNGDLFDFLQVGVSAHELASEEAFAGVTKDKDRRYLLGYGAKTDQASSAFKLRKIAGGHPGFFAALRRFTAAGNKVTIIPGNHDVELFWPAVQDQFRELVRPANVGIAADGGAFAGIAFAPWVFYDRDFSVYIEHGHQYESLNSFRYWLNPVLPRARAELNLPVGSFFVRYLLNGVEALNPFADNIKPNTKYVAWAMKTDPLGFRRLLKLLWRFFVTLAKIWRRSGDLSVYSPADIAFFEADTDRRLAEVAREFNFRGDIDSPSHPLRRILKLRVRPFNDGRLRFAWRAVFANLDVLLFLVSAASFAGWVLLTLRFGVRNVFAAASLATTVIGAVAGNLFYSASAKADKAILASVKKISRILEETGNPAWYIAFGHTHQPDIIGFDDKLYFNTGTWGVIFEEEEELIRDKKQFAFLIFEGPGAEPELMRWNDALGAPEPLPLFDKPEVV